MLDVKGDLTPVEWQELRGLMREARWRWPTPLLERRIRDLLVHVDRRAADMPWLDLREFGLVTLGCHLLAQFVAEGRVRPAPPTMA